MKIIIKAKLSTQAAKILADESCRVKISETEFLSRSIAIQWRKFLKRRPSLAGDIPLNRPRVPFVLNRAF